MRAYYINLDRRPDRKEQVEAEITRMGFTPVRITAIDGQLWDGVGYKARGNAREHYWRGMAGCYFSHLKALRFAIAEDAFPCLICEDDTIFRGDIPESFPYPMTLLGGNYVKGKGVYLAHAIRYDTRQIAEQFLQVLEKYKGAPDAVCVKFQKLAPTLCGSLQTYIAFQRESHSDILGESVKRVHHTTDGVIQRYAEVAS